MKVRTTIAGTAFRARLTALCWGALTLAGSGGRFGLQWVHFDADCAHFLSVSDHLGHGDRARFRWHSASLRRHGVLHRHHRLRYARRPP